VPAGSKLICIRGIARKEIDMAAIRMAACAALCAVSSALMSGIGPAQAETSQPAAMPDKAKAIVFAELDSRTGNDPLGNVVLASDGNYYGTSWQGGKFRCGTIYRIRHSGPTKAIYDFKCGADGYQPSAPLIEGIDGALYGASHGTFDGPSGAGVLFRLAPDGTFTVLHAFKSDASEGGVPITALVQARDGHLYGTTVNGGANGDFGVLYRVSPGGDFAVVASLDGQRPYWPFGQPLEGDDGNFYLTAQAGGQYGLGGLLRVSPTGTVTTLYEFAGGQDGGRPWSSLVYDAAHEFMWGVSTVGNCVFRYRAGTVETVACIPSGTLAGLTLGPDRVHFYAIVAPGGQIYSIAPDGTTQAIIGGCNTWSLEQLIFNPAGTMLFTCSSWPVGLVYKIKRF
jgi:uncharacterized repeat protein (TIGR03803 family)